MQMMAVLTTVIFTLSFISTLSLEFKPFSFMTKQKPPNKINGIVELLNGSKNDILNKQNDIIALIDDLKTSQPPQNNDYSLVDGNWDLLWTTEKETLFFKEKGLFGKECMGISQNIDTESLIINNLIEFQDGRRFSVDGKINIDSGKLERINFAFSGATITIPPFNVPLPPVGKGWFDTLYVDKLYRVSYDVRGDYLVSKRKI
mmetsp:Transcript_28455/g.27259  ORF Transcript_28455/g.27259 Transcript_28455/m.27259 type:complete len:203 (+) Transcript_28455:139-747(+)